MHTWAYFASISLSLTAFAQLLGVIVYEKPTDRLINMAMFIPSTIFATEGFLYASNTWH